LIDDKILFFRPIDDKTLGSNTIHNKQQDKETKETEKPRIHAGFSPRSAGLKKAAEFFGVVPQARVNSGLTMELPNKWRTCS